MNEVYDLFLDVALAPPCLGRSCCLTPLPIEKSQRAWTHPLSTDTTSTSAAGHSFDCELGWTPTNAPMV